MKESCIYQQGPVVPHDQVPKTIHPGKSAFNLPAFPISPKLAAIIKNVQAILPSWDNQVDPSLPHPFPERPAVIPLVGNNPLRLLFGTATTRAGNSDRTQRFFRERDFRRGRRYNADAERYPLAVDHNHPLRALAPLGFPHSVAPPLAGAKLPSMKTSSHSSRPLASNSPSMVCQMSCQRSASAHMYIRRQQVEGDGYSSGRSCQLAPVFRIQRIPSRQRRLSAQGRPPFLLLGRSGSNGSSFSHIPSVKNLRRAMDSSYSIVHGFVHKINLLKNPKSGYETTSSLSDQNRRKLIEYLYLLNVNDIL